MLGPKSHSIHMFISRCIQPPCRNIIEKKRAVDVAGVGGNLLSPSAVLASRRNSRVSNRHIDGFSCAEKREACGDEAVLGRDFALLDIAHLAEPAHDQNVGGDDQQRDDRKSQPRIQNVERKEHGIGGAALRASG